MRRVPIGAALLALAALVLAEEPPKPAPRIANGAWAKALKAHPRLLGPAAYLKELAASKPDAYKALAKHASLDAAAIVHAVEGDKKGAPFIEKTLQDVAKGPTNLHQDTWIALDEAAQAYDLFHNEIPAEDRSKIVEWMNAHLGTYTQDEGAFHNSTLSKVMAYLHVAYATWGENPRAKEWRDEALSRLYEKKLLPVLQEFGAGGGYTEGGWYTRASLWNLVQALELARRFEGYDGFAKAPRFFYERLAYECHQPFPGKWDYGCERYSVEGDGSNVYGGHNEYPRFTRELLATYFRGSELARHVGARRRKPSNPEAAIADFLWQEDADPAPEKELPLSHLASGIGRVYARSDWSDDATWLRFECGPFFCGHQHYECGNFEIYRRAPLATESGEYEDYLSSHSVNWLIRTIAHNCVLVFMEGEKWTDMRDGGRSEVANDGGQAKKWDQGADTLELWKSKREAYERGSIVAYENHPEWLYTACDATKAFSPKKVSLWTRQVVFVRPATFVILDHVVAAKPDYEKTWLLHARNEPRVVGSTFTVEDGKGHLSVATLLPQKASIKTVEGWTYGGKTFDEKKNSQTATAARWRVEVQPSTASSDDLFLHVLQTADEPASASLVKASGRVGVKVGNVEVVFDSKLGGTVTIDGKAHKLEAKVVKGRFE